MNTQEEAEHIVYACTGEPKMLPDAPYQKRLIEMIATALEAARDDARHAAGRCIVQVADSLLHDPKSDGVDGHVSAVLREIGTKLTELTIRTPGV